MHTTRPIHILARSVATLLVASSSAFAADWLGGTSSDWNDGTNWTGGVVPAGQNAYIGISGGGNPPFTATITADVPQASDILVARGGGPAILNHTAGIASTGNDQWVDIGTAGGTGTYNLGVVGGTPGILTGIGLGSGTLRAGGGNGGAGRLYVGGVDFSNAGGSGIFNVNTTGTVQIDNDLTIGTGGGTGVMNVDAGTITTGGWNFIGKPDNGNGAANGTLKMSGGSLTNGGGRTYVGNGNTVGRIELSGTGTYNNIGDWFAVGHDNLANATPSSIDMTGSGALNTSLLSVGGSPDNPGKGSLTMSGAAQLSASELWVGNRGNSIGSAAISAGTLSVNSWLALGRDNSTGTLTISGTATVNQGITDAGSSFEMTNFGVGGTATVHLDGGSLTVNRIEHAGNATATSTFNFNGGTLKPRVSAGNFMGGLTRANVRDGGARIDTEGFNITIAQALLHSDIGGDAAIDGGLTKSDNGALTLSGTSDYTGSTEIDAGALLLTGALTATSAVNVDSGATLGGTGTINSAATVSVAGGGVLSPGLSPGILSTGSVSLSSGSDFVLEINGSLLGTDYDNLNVTGGVSLGSADLLVTLGTGFAPTPGQTFTVVSNDLADPILGLFGSVNGGAFGAGDTFSLTNDQGTFDFILHYDGDGAAPTGGNDVVLEVVPEPGVVVSLLGGVGVLLGLRRRRS